MIKKQKREPRRGNRHESSRYSGILSTPSAHGVKAPVVKAERRMPTPKMPEEDRTDDELEDNEA
jgi:hypothetical protein